MDHSPATASLSTLGRRSSHGHFPTVNRILVYLSTEAPDRDTAWVISQGPAQEWPEPVVDHPVPGMHLWGWMTPDQLGWLSAQAARMQSVAEVGSLYGRSSFALLSACNGPVYCIDPWPGHRYDSFMDHCGH